MKLVLFPNDHPFVTSYKLKLRCCLFRSVQEGVKNS